VKLDYLRGPRPEKLGVRFNTLITSIRAWTESDLIRKVIIGKAGTNVWYGELWETGKMPARAPTKKQKYKQLKGVPTGPPASVKTRPFLKPALRDNEKIIQNFIREAVSEGARR